MIGTLDENIAQTQELALAELAKDLTDNWPLNRSTSSWAGGEHDVTLHIGNSPFAVGTSHRAWSRNGKWSGTNSSASLTCTLSALQHFPTLRTADGAVILDATEIAANEYHVVYIKQGRGFGLTLESGFVIRGYRYKASTIAAARKKASQAL